MKASLKLREEHQTPLLRAKIPVTVLGFPLISGITAGDISDLSLLLRTSSDAGPSFNFSYKPNDRSNPFSISLKSGIGVFGSPENSPLILSAHFSLLGNANPSFSLQIRPQFGDFSLKRTVLSSFFPNPNPISNPIKENSGIGLAPSLLTNFSSGAGLFHGVSVIARTELPVTKRTAARFRWGVNFPANLGEKLPFLTVDKISVERFEKPAANVSSEDQSNIPAKGAGDLEILKGMSIWMGREVEALQKENRLMKESIEELKKWGYARRNRGEIEAPTKISPEIGDISGEFEGWRKKKSGVGEAKCGGFSGGKASTATDVEEELKRAIKAAST